MNPTLESLLETVGLSGASLASLLIAGAATVLASIAVCTAFVVLMPADYFSLRRHPPTERRGLHGVAVLWIRNLCGAALILLGLCLSLPGIPLPGPLLILIGFSFTDFPSKPAMQQKLLRRPSVEGRINRLRQKFGKPPIVLGC